jgi:flavin reductase (DIM6/NTAB) family NADH-FMN oxidoreductase RutF
MEKIDPFLAFQECRCERISLVTTIDSDGKPNIMSAAWNMKTSYKPATLVISLRKKAYSHKLIRESKEFVVAIANESLRDAVLVSGTNSGIDCDKIERLNLETQPASLVKPPLVSQATYNFECELLNEMDAGDHILFLGKVVAAHKADTDKGYLVDMPMDNDKRVFKNIQ